MTSARYVVLHHDHPFPHFDLMLERGLTLAAWRILDVPEPGRSVAAEKLGDHRRDYLDYEGPVPGGRGSVSGGRGSVRRVASGHYEPISWGEDRVEARLDGSGAWAGEMVLARKPDGAWTAYLILSSGSPRSM